MSKKIGTILAVILLLEMKSVTSAEASSFDIPYFAKETVQITENIILVPFRLIRDIFDPPPPALMAPYYYLPPSGGYGNAVVPAAAPMAAALQAPVNLIDVLEVRLPNGDGSHTVVTLKKTEKGFLGPQGEFYADRPSEKQLRDRYTGQLKPAAGVTP